MTGLHYNLFVRIISRNREVYLLKILTLAIAFASSVLIILFSLNEFGYDGFHEDPYNVFRVLQKNADEQYSGNRLSVKIPSDVVRRLKEEAFKDSLIISPVKVMNKVIVLSGDESFHDQKIHAADPSISDIFSFEIVEGDARDFNSSTEVMAMVSSRAARKYTGSPQAVGKIIKLYTFRDTVEVRVAAVFRDFPRNSHEDFDFFIAFDTEAITALNFDPRETGVYGRARMSIPEHYKFPGNGIVFQGKMTYTLQPLPQLYFGPRVLSEEARHGDSYSVIILISITSLILFLALTSFVNLTTITLPYRSKELAVKKLAGTNQRDLLYGFLTESLILVGISFIVGFLILITTSDFIASTLDVQLQPMIFKLDARPWLIAGTLLAIFAVSPVVMSMTFIRATPNRLLSTDTITFPRLKRVITFLQLGTSIFLIIASVVVRRQINYSLLKEPGFNHDQIVYLNSPSGITNEGIRALRSGWKEFNPNILDVMAVSQLPDRISSKEIGSDFYLLFVDHGFREFFDLGMEEGNWFRPNAGDSIIVTNRKGREQMGKEQANVIGVLEDLVAGFNQPEKPVKIKLSEDYEYNWLCVRVLEVDIRRTVNRLADQFSSQERKAHVNYMDKHFESWIAYQDRLNTLSGILTIISVLLSCCAIYGLTVSLVRDKLKQIAVHKLFGARATHITYLLVLEFVKQMVIALAVFGPLTYILLNELLRTFVYSTKLLWFDPVLPIAYCMFVIVAICGLKALSLNRTDIASALKG